MADGYEEKNVYPSFEVDGIKVAHFYRTVNFMDLNGQSKQYGYFPEDIPILSKIFGKLKQEMEKYKMEKWNAKITLEVKGPNEGPVTVQVSYEDTTREMCESLQNAFAQLGLKLNQGK